MSSRSYLKHFFRSGWTDIINRVKFRSSIPAYAERIWVNPQNCSGYLSPSDTRKFFSRSVRNLSGRIVSNWPDHFVQPLSAHPVLRYCLTHWRDGKTWQDAGAVDYMLENIACSPIGVSDNCRNEQDVLNRFAALDEAWRAVQVQGRLMTREEMFPDNFREVGGILMHIGPGGVPVFSGAGCHRFAMALVLGRPFPAQLGCIHISALDSLPSLRLLE